MNHTLIVIKSGRQDQFRRVFHAVHDIPGLIVHGLTQFSVGSLSFKIIPADAIQVQVAGLLLNKKIIIHQTAITQNDAARIANRIRAAKGIEFIFTNTAEELGDEVRKEIAGPLVPE